VLHSHLVHKGTEAFFRNTNPALFEIRIRKSDHLNILLVENLLSTNVISYYANHVRTSRNRNDFDGSLDRNLFFDASTIHCRYQKYPTDVKTCFDLTPRIEDDLQTLINLCAKHEKYLLTVPDTLRRLDRIIYATKDSILDVCRLLEGCRKEVYEGNTIPLGSKMKWVLGDNVAFAGRTANLQQQHAALNVEIVSLRQIDVLKPLEWIATTTFENVELLSMERRKVQKRESRFEIGEFYCP
jgi:hypothetical protein